MRKGWLPFARRWKRGDQERRGESGQPFAKRLRSALAAVTVAVVGVILNLAVWFGMRVIFPAGGGIDWIAIALGVVTFIGLVKWKWDVIAVVVGGDFCGLMLHFLRG